MTCLLCGRPARYICEAIKTDHEGQEETWVYSCYQSCWDLPNRLEKVEEEINKKNILEGSKWN